MAYQQRQIEMAVNLIFDGALRENDSDNRLREISAAVIRVVNDWNENLLDDDIQFIGNLSPWNIERAIKALAEEYEAIRGESKEMLARVSAAD